ncbi:UNVERIFIED_CONTAM: hypothetical protein Sradi_1422700 [Sesamum radiatum]|uniref:Heparan-alpha-glucosaminide N-acetyltransferase n=1 Tax=Sesamum radiatum TaxID=300843 RepID=A0AAW2UUF2_SESRA
MRGSLKPPCNSVGFIDRTLLGEKHLYQRPVYRRTKECSINSPDYGPLPPDSPTWCLAPFDPEGILSSLMAAITCFVGLHYGHVLVHCKDQMQRVIFWFISSLPLLILGYLLSFLGVPYSKPLYTLSYMFITAGASGVLLTAIYLIVDVKCIRKPTVIFQWMGMNALIVYALAACDIFPAAVQGFYWRSPENNLGEVALKRSIYIVVKASGGLESKRFSKSSSLKGYCSHCSIQRSGVLWPLSYSRSYFGVLSPVSST